MDSRHWFIELLDRQLNRVHCYTQHATSRDDAIAAAYRRAELEHGRCAGSWKLQYVDKIV